jgi:hypothetical protein
MDSKLGQQPNEHAPHPDSQNEEAILEKLQELRLMPTKWERNLFDKPWLPVVMLFPIVGLFMIGLAEDVYYYVAFYRDSGTPFQLFVAYFSLDAIYVVLALLTMIVVWLYQRFEKQMQRVWVALWKSKKLSPKTKAEGAGDTTSTLDFLRQCESDLSSPKRYILVGVVLLIVDIILARHIRTEATLSFATFPDVTSSLFDLFKMVFFADLWFVILTSAGYSMLVSVKYIRRLPQGLSLAVVPSHPDRCGGLKPIGDICLQLALIAVIAGLVLAYFGSVGEVMRTAGFLPKLSDEDVRQIVRLLPESISSQRIERFRELFDPTREPQPITRSFANFGTLVGIIGGGWLYCYPVLGIHRWMTDKKAEFVQILAEAASEFDIGFEQSIRAKDEERIRNSSSKLETLQNSYSLLQRYPVWPTSRRGFAIKFVTPEFFTIVGLILSVDVSIASKILEWISQ